MGLIDKENVNR